jgi:hypothetical protein
MARITPAKLRFALTQMAELTGENKFVVIGRGSLAVTAPEHLRGLALTDDIDLWPRNNETAALDECIQRYGSDSEFYLENGFYIERVGEWTLMTQPKGWENRATEFKTGEITALILGLSDLIYNKLEAFRVKDQEFLSEAFAKGLADPEEIQRFIEEYAPNEERRTLLLKNLELVKPKKNKRESTGQAIDASMSAVRHIEPAETLGDAPSSNGPGKTSSGRRVPER